jgi:hypothetical protein
MTAERRTNARRTLACVALAVMWLMANQPLHVSDGRPHGCDGPDAAASQVIASPVQTGCQHAGVICLTATGCIMVAPALVPAGMTLPGLLPPACSCEVRLTPIADLFQSGPPTPPPNN